MHQIKWQQLTISRLCADFGWSILREDCGLLAKSFAVEDSKIPERCLASRIWPGFLPRVWISDNGNMIPIAAAGAQCQCLDGIHFTTWMCMFNLEFSNCNHFIYLTPEIIKLWGHFGSPTRDARHRACRMGILHLSVWRSQGPNLKTVARTRMNHSFVNLGYN